MLNLYYYTTHREDGDVDSPHFTLYKHADGTGETNVGEAVPEVSHAIEASPVAMELGAEYRKSGGAKA